jgi:hypothetical protein
VNVHVIAVVNPWIVPPGSTPFVVTSELAGKEIEIFKKVVAPEFNAPLCRERAAGDAKAATEVEFKMVVSIPPQVPVFGYAVEHCFTTTCNPLVASVANKPDPAAPKVIADEFKVPGFERIT